MGMTLYSVGKFVKWAQDYLTRADNLVGRTPGERNERIAELMRARMALQSALDTLDNNLKAELSRDDTMILDRALIK